MSDRNWLRGYCWDMAVALHETTHLPLAGLFDAKGHCHHALVWDERLDVGIDARGAKQLDSLRKGCAGGEMRPLKREEIEGPGGWLGRPLEKAEIAVAKKFIAQRQVLNGWHLLMRAQGLEQPEKPSMRRRAAP